MLRCQININVNVKVIQNNLKANVKGNHWIGFKRNININVKWTQDNVNANVKGIHWSFWSLHPRKQKYKEACTIPPL